MTVYRINNESSGERAKRRVLRKIERIIVGIKLFLDIEMEAEKGRIYFINQNIEEVNAYRQKLIIFK